MVRSGWRQKMGFFEHEGLDVPIVTMRGSPLAHSSADGRLYLSLPMRRSTLSSAPMRKALDITMIGGLINGLEHEP